MPLLAVVAALALSPAVSAGYEKLEFRIPMRDGVKLYTAVFVPRGGVDFPILMERTPYSAGPYEKDSQVPDQDFSPYVKAGYGLAYQDVRGQYQSEGTYVNVRPQLAPGEKGIDESTDTYDTIDYLVKHVKGNNGRVGLRGISYPGFYAAVGALSRHPALKAVSPQAPVSDWFRGDDVRHNGAFFLQDNFGFCAWFDVPRQGLETEHPGLPVPEPKNGAYAFFLSAGSAEGLDNRYLRGRIPYWKEIIDHDTYDAYWKARVIPPRLTGIRCAVLTVGGWFDAEDFWGPLHDYAAIERSSPDIENVIAIGPWSHGEWSDRDASSLNGMEWGMNTAAWYRDHVEFPFFEKHLRGIGSKPLPEATVFETGANQWRTFEQWPPKGLTEKTIYMDRDHGLAESAGAAGKDSYVNDPDSPTPYLEDPKRTDRPGDLLAQNETWAAKRTDVLSYIGEPLGKAITVAGPIDVDLWVTTTGTDGDFIVKVLDIAPKGEPHAGEMRMVRADVLRGRFRNSLEKPEPFVPEKPTEVKFRLNDVLHTFKPGHRMAVQIQSSWFPLVDRNPNRFVPNVERAQPKDLQKATISVLRGGMHASSIKFGVL